MLNIKEHSLAYLEKKLPFCIVNDLNDREYEFTCPQCLEVGCTFDSQWKMKCSKCGGHLGNVITYFAQTENKSEDLIIADMKKRLELSVYSDKNTQKYLDYYEKQGFDLLPVLRNGKEAFQKNWPNISYKNKEEWDTWLQDGLNIGVKTGRMSNIIVLDFDGGNFPDELSFLNHSTTLTQKTKKGWHLFYKYDTDIPNARIDKWQLDIQSDGAQVVIYPSIVENTERSFTELCDIEEMPENLKKLILDNLDKSKIKKKEELLELPKNLDLSKVDFDNIEEGTRNVAFMHLGGILRKQLNSKQTEYVLRIFNQHFCKPSLDERDLYRLFQSIDKYIDFDERECASRVLQYFRIVEEASAKDVEQALGYKKELTDKTISYLLKEGYIYKRRRLYYLSKKAEWRDEFFEDNKEVSYKTPYFHNYAIVREGDMIVVGAKQKVGKSHIALNMLKRVVEQGIKPYYISLESGNRFVNIAKNLCMKDGDFNWCIHFNPEDIEIEDNAFTIIDWLLPDDYANTDKLFKHFAEQLVKHHGTLVIFVQLKDNGDYFAKNMIAMFPSIVSRYMYEDEENGEKGAFFLDYVREARTKSKRQKIPCEYNWETKELIEVT